MKKRKPCTTPCEKALPLNDSGGGTYHQCRACGYDDAPRYVIERPFNRVYLSTMFTELPAPIRRKGDSA